MKLSFFIDSAHPAKAKTASHGGCCGLTDEEEQQLTSHLALRLQHRLRPFLDKQGNAVGTLHNFRLHVNRKSLFPTRRSMMVVPSRSLTAAANRLAPWASHRGELGRLLISAPPGSAKSQTASVLFPAFFLANNHAAQIVTASTRRT
jgi:hypothetical protein